MKRILVLLALTASLVSCGSDVKTQYLEIIQSSTQELRDAKSYEELTKAGDNFSEKIKAFEEKHKEDIEKLQKDEAAKAEVLSAMQTFVTTGMQKSMELAARDAHQNVDDAKKAADRLADSLYTPEP
jgi:hypothetical protein